MEEESVKVLELATFTPRETEKITNVSQAIQRDWRRRELTSFDTRKGRKRFSSEDLAHLIVMKQLLPCIRPAIAYRLARMSCTDPISVLAKRAYPSTRVKLGGENCDRRDILRYAVYCRFMNDAMLTCFNVADLNMLSERMAKEKLPLAFHVIVDAFAIANELQLRQIKPYFIETRAP